MREPRPPEERPPFRRRLLLTFGAVAGSMLALLGAALCVAAYGWFLHDAQRLLGEEAEEVEHEVVTATGRLEPARYAWDEPHHVFADARIDPYFLQVFDTRGRLLEASANIARLPAYPAALLPATAGGLQPLATFRAGDQRLYRVTAPLRDPSGRVIGYVQLARRDPHLGRSTARAAAAILGGLGAVFLALLVAVGAVGRRVVRPLEQITAHARALSAPTLGARVPVPDDGDRETALLARALNDALDRIDRSFEEVRRFTSDAAHELQTPLTALRGHVDVALRRERDPAAHRETLGVLRIETERLIAMVRGLLALARMEGGIGPPGAPVDLAALAAEEVAAAGPRAAAAGLRLASDVGAPASVHGHPELLREVVRNLLDNALKYTDAGTVRVVVGPDDGHVRLAVEDTGRGMTADEAAHATARFWRADAARPLPGSGLGLAVVRSIVEAAGGTVRVESAGPGRGTRVEVRLPAWPPAESTS